MRKIRYIFLLYLLMVLPIFVEAKTYSPSDTDLNISMDDTSWYVFTKDNIYNNSELNDIGITYEYMNEYMEDNDIYLDAILFDEEDTNDNLEFFIRIIDIEDKVGNLHAYSEKDINEFGDYLIESGKFNTNTFKVYGNQYKFIELEYTDSGYNLYQFYTTINGSGYNFVLQKINKITDEDKTAIKNIIDSINFKIDEEYEKPIGADGSILNSAISGAIRGAIIGALTALVLKIFKKKKKTDNNNQNGYTQ